MKKIRLSKFVSSEEKNFVELCQKHNIKYLKNEKNEYVLSFEPDYLDRTEKYMNNFWKDNGIKYKLHIDENQIHHYEFENSLIELPLFTGSTIAGNTEFSQFNQTTEDLKSDSHKEDFNENKLFELYSSKKSEIPPMPTWKKLLGKVNKKIIENYNNHHENKNNEERLKIGKERLLALAGVNLNKIERDEEKKLVNEIKALLKKFEINLNKDIKN